MFGHQAHLKALESRRQLLIAESELNRHQALQEWDVFAEEVRQVAERARSLNSLAASFISVVSGFSELTAGRRQAASVGGGWFHRLATGARFVSTLWFLYRSSRAAFAKR